MTTFCPDKYQNGEKRARRQKINKIIRYREYSHRRT
jgi:hypothetical protein